MCNNYNAMEIALVDLRCKDYHMCCSAAAALDRFAMKRFYDNKCGGVTQPSQRKYVHHFADLLAGRIDFNSQ